MKGTDFPDIQSLARKRIMRTSRRRPPDRTVVQLDSDLERVFPLE
jgi:hypothetical protein